MKLEISSFKQTDPKFSFFRVTALTFVFFRYWTLVVNLDCSQSAVYKQFDHILPCWVVDGISIFVLGEDVLRDYAFILLLLKVSSDGERSEY